MTHDNGVIIPIKVECYAGHRGEEAPRRFHVGGKAVEVDEVLDRWLAPGHRYFKVRDLDGHTWILRRDDEADRWELHMYKHAGLL